ncbi:Hypothetical protein PP7435_CHR3-0415 [Komagataella phaffii CBS 7435]|uniref:Ada DNA repair metal-binding domain-containing protein n=2 Tax=Komagataella phaffii TaxID=460519 RepID=C4R5J4_KOMPG|nr:Hypothetical protein PAS_chr3_0778 [Komagataella phaffii GS115]AOA64219.1 GQ67_03878T0 [Komagataella phaffii]CAH2449385.1 Hypothetical protein BQ9382_C3-2235 [Komagataella phaffii CBS 7435]AOA68215.1 GQ68_03852T0 [Komagataella phaffii GS115]CAY70830.1 Hypothetical protein PAS_chr3_0778 [Komagataella phaffii GS115]CCA39377.1 Hypothetical protein PP7435_CHR3-0415 [Komagataella phaffii CBS 7435]
MSYHTEASRWNAYQFNDPFAADKFFVCSRRTNTCCRPNCGLGFNHSNEKSDVSFVDTIEEAEQLGFSKCRFCIAPNHGGDINTLQVDVNLLVRTVEHVNHQIGFMPPLLDEEEEKENTIKHSFIKNKIVGRRQSVPDISDSGNGLSKNENDHLKLIDLACRHIALAAACALMSSKHASAEEALMSSSNADENRKRRKRRGGVLGFKELAAKSKLSPWHFHRVFKSVAGLTPKAYGDRCCEYIRQHDEKYGVLIMPGSTERSNSVIEINTQIANPSSPKMHNSQVEQAESASMRPSSSERNQHSHNANLVAPSTANSTTSTSTNTQTLPASNISSSPASTAVFEMDHNTIFDERPASAPTSGFISPVSYISSSEKMPQVNVDFNQMDFNNDIWSMLQNDRAPSRQRGHYRSFAAPETMMDDYLKQDNYDMNFDFGTEPSSPVVGQSQPDFVFNSSVFQVKPQAQQHSISEALSPRLETSLGDEDDNYNPLSLELEILNQTQPFLMEDRTPAVEISTPQ